MTVEAVTDRRVLEEQQRQYKRELHSRIRSLNDDVKEFITGAALMDMHPKKKDTTLKVRSFEDMSPLPSFIENFFAVDPSKHPGAYLEMRLHSDSDGHHITLALSKGEAESKHQIRHVTITTEAVWYRDPRIHIESSDVFNPQVVSLQDSSQRHAYYGAQSLKAIEDGSVEGQIKFAKSMMRFLAGGEGTN